MSVLWKFALWLCGVFCFWTKHFCDFYEINKVLRGKLRVDYKVTVSICERGEWSFNIILTCVYWCFFVMAMAIVKLKCHGKHNISRKGCGEYQYFSGNQLYWCVYKLFHGRPFILKCARYTIWRCGVICQKII